MLLGHPHSQARRQGPHDPPAKFRDELGGGVVMTRGQERCLYVFSTREFERMHERIRQAPLTNKQARDFLRMFLSGASAEKPDSQNRVTIPPPCAPTPASSATSPSSASAPTPRSGTPTRGTRTPKATKTPTPRLEQEVIPGLF